MSWNVNIKPGTIDQVREAILDAELPDMNDVEAIPAAQDQLSAAKEAVLGILENGAVGDDGSYWSVYMGGHANPNHLPRSGWALEFVHITLSEMAAPEQPSDEGRE